MSGNATARIVELEAEVERLRVALEAIAQHSLNDPACPAYKLGHIAERSLTLPKEGEKE